MYQQIAPILYGAKFILLFNPEDLYAAVVNNFQSLFSKGLYPIQKQLDFGHLEKSLRVKFSTHYCVVYCNTVQCVAVQCSLIPYGIVQCNMVLCSILQCSIQLSVFVKVTPGPDLARAQLSHSSRTAEGKQTVADILTALKQSQPFNQRTLSFSFLDQQVQAC